MGWGGVPSQGGLSRERREGDSFGDGVGRKDVGGGGMVLVKFGGRGGGEDLYFGLIPKRMGKLEVMLMPNS